MFLESSLHSSYFTRKILLKHEGLKNFLIKNTQEQLRLEIIQKMLSEKKYHSGSPINSSFLTSK